MKIKNENHFKIVCRAFFPDCEFVIDHECFNAVNAVFGGCFIFARYVDKELVCNAPGVRAWVLGEFFSKDYTEEKSFVKKLYAIKKDFRKRGF